MRIKSGLMKLSVSKPFLLLSGLVIGFVAAEIMARLLLPSPMIVRVTCRNEQGHHNFYYDVGEKSGLYYYTGSGWALRKNCRAQIVDHYISHRSITMETDENGFRKSPGEAPSGAKEVLFLGDSITLADYLEDNLTIPELFASFFASRGVPIKSTNAAVATAGISRELEIMKDALAARRPDLILVNFFLNDARNCCAIYSTPVSWPWTNSSFVSNFARILQFLTHPVINFEQDLTPQQFDSWRSSAVNRLKTGHGSSEFQSSVLENFGTWGNAWSDEAWERMNKQIESICWEAKSRHIPVAFIAYPVSYQISIKGSDSFPQEQLRRKLVSLQVPMLDLLPVLSKDFESRKTVPYFDDAHPTEVGNELIAEAIVNFVEEENLLSRP